MTHIWTPILLSRRGVPSRSVNERWKGLFKLIAKDDCGNWFYQASRKRLRKELQEGQIKMKTAIFAL